MKAPELTRLQRAWLQEIGLDQRMLARHAVGNGAHGDLPVAPSVAQPAETRAAEAAAKFRPSGSPGMPVVPRGPIQSQDVPESKLDNKVLPVPEQWDALQPHVASCRACELHSSRSQAVFGAGAHESPEWLIVGEAPGDFDDRAGLPFQGQAGVLLKAMLASVGVSMDGMVYCTNLVKCRPLGNRIPTPEEITACLPYLKRQIALLKPRRIVALGRLAAQALLGQDGDLDSLRGQVHVLTSESGEAIPLVATYHPAALLLRPQHKLDTWKDLKLARSVG